jgi:hypothetical protein
LQSEGIQKSRKNPVYRYFLLVCAGLAVAVLFHAGIKLVPSYLEHQSFEVQLQKYLEEHVQEIVEGQPVPGFTWTSPPGWLVLLVVVLLLCLPFLGGLIDRRAARHRAKSAIEEIGRSGGRPPVLYLRSFALDEEFERRSCWFFDSLELPMTQLLSKCGPVIAIGKPGERLPPLGAARFYVDDQHWRDKIIDAVNASQLVLWTTGTSDGLRWEIAYLVRALSPKRLMLWAHPHLLRIPKAEREGEWLRFVNSVSTIFPCPLPAQLGETRLFVFNANFEAIAIAPSQNRWTERGRQVDSLKTALLAGDYTQLAHSSQPQELKRRRLFFASALTVTAILCVAFWVALSA